MQLSSSSLIGHVCCERSHFLLFSVPMFLFTRGRGYLSTWIFYLEDVIPQFLSKWKYFFVVVVSVISNPLLLKAVTSGHQRSESSTDSFVCVSEETGLESERSPSRAAADTESWEHIGSGGSGGESHESSGGRASDVEEEDVKKGLDRLFKKHGSPLQCSEEDLTDLGVSKTAAEGTGTEGETECNLSDWEKWDD